MRARDRLAIVMSVIAMLISAFVIAHAFGPITWWVTPARAQQVQPKPAPKTPLDIAAQLRCTLWPKECASKPPPPPVPEAKPPKRKPIPTVRTKPAPEVTSVPTAQPKVKKPVKVAKPKVQKPKAKKAKRQPAPSTTVQNRQGWCGDKQLSSCGTIQLLFSIGGSCSRICSGESDGYSKCERDHGWKCLRADQKQYVRTCIRTQCPNKRG